MPSITALTYIAVSLAGTLATVFISPFYGILLYQLNFFVDPHSRWWFGDLPDLRYSFLIMSLVLLGYLARLGQYRENRLGRLPQFKWLAALMAVVVVSYFWAVSPELHAEFSLRYCKVILFTVLAYKVVDTPQKVEKLLGVYLLGIFYLSFLAWQLGRTQGGRLEGIGCADTTDANGTAAVVVTALPLLVFYLLFGKKLWVRALSLLGCAFVMNSLILFNSRGSFLALICGGLYFTWFIFREKLGRAIKMKVACGAIVAVGLFAYLADDTFLSRMETMSEPTEEGRSGASRITFWMTTFQMLEAHPLGAGARGFHLLSANYLPAESLSRGVRAVHSTWFEALSEYGYHGLLLFLGYLGSTFLLMRRVRAVLREASDSYLVFQSIALESSLICLLAAGSFINFFYGELMYWLPMYMGVFANVHMFARSSKGFSNEPA